MIPVLPIASMIDILFLMLIFFLTASAFREQDSQIDVSLPATESTRTLPSGRTQITITVQPDGEIYMGEQRYTIDELRGTLRQLAAQFPDESVLIRADRESRVGLAVRIMDLAYEANLRNVFLATSRPRSEL